LNVVNDWITSRRGENLAEALVGLFEILIEEPPSGLGMLGLQGSVVRALILGLVFVLLLVLRFGLGIGHGVEKTRGRVRLELEVAILASDDPRNEELAAGEGVGVGLR
jgi:hypothetical protein